MAAARPRRLDVIGILDTNAVLYLLGGRVASPPEPGIYGISIITEMELLAWPSLATDDEQSIRAFVNRVVVCELTPRIRATAVRLRRDFRLKLPDAIVCATALECQVPLFTNDEQLGRIPTLVIRNLALSPP